jgi:hypothetical protein
VSTVLDVTVCLLLIVVAVGTLTPSIPTDGERLTVDGSAVATSLTTVTTTIETDASGTVHGTLSEHLAGAAVVGTTLDGRRLGPREYQKAVERAISDEVPRRTHVSARWTPYADAPLESRVEIGSEPPETADIAVTSRTIDSGITVPTAGEAGAGAFDALADSIARAYVDRLFPPARIRVQLTDPRTADETAMRYRAVAERLGGTPAIEAALADASSSRANEQLATALADRIESDLRASRETPQAAAASLNADRVDLVVRRWEP